MTREQLARCIGALAYPLASVVVGFYVPGKPQTAGSKTAFVNPRTGKPIITESGTKESKKAKKTWRGDLRDAAEGARPEDWDLGAPMAATFTFIRKRPSAQLRTGQHAGAVKDWALGLYPVEQPDGTKLARAAEDALTGVLWHDDAQIVDGPTPRKRFGDQVGMDPRAEGVIVEVMPLPASDGHASLALVPDEKDSA